MDLQGKKVLITGGSLGIGKATAKVLKEAGAEVAITARHKEPLEKTASELGIFAIQMDVGKQDDINRTWEKFLEKFGGLDILINNAGIGGGGKLESLTRNDFEKVYSVNVIGAAMMAQRAAEIFKEQKHGNIINIGSTAAGKGYEGGTVYSSSKHALRGMTDCWRHELRKYNIRVFLVNPSEVTTAIGNPERKERENQPNKLRPQEIAHSIKAILEMDDRGFIPELAVWATNPW